MNKSGKNEIFHCTPCRFAVGDAVQTPTGVGKITAIGRFAKPSDKHRELCYQGIVYRVGKRTYWFYWQLRSLRKKRKVYERQVDE